MQLISYRKERLFPSPHSSLTVFCALSCVCELGSNRLHRDLGIAFWTSLLSISNNFFASDGSIPMRHESMNYAQGCGGRNEKRIGKILPVILYGHIMGSNSGD